MQISFRMEVFFFFFLFLCQLPCLVWGSCLLSSEQVNNFNCYDSFGDPLDTSITHSVPSWGTCEGRCSATTYPQPLYGMCDGDSSKWQPPLEDVQCKESEVIIMSGGYDEKPDVLTITGTRVCDSPNFYMPFGRHWHSMNFDEANKVVYICGGQCLLSKTCVKNDLKSNRGWEEVANKMPQSRAEHGSALANGKLYIVGGYSLTNQRPMREVHMLDLATEEWTEMPEMPHALRRLCAAIVQNKLYAIGGLGFSMRQILELDLNNPQAGWVEKRGTLQTRRAMHACHVFDGDIMISGGDELMGPIHATVERYSPEFDTSDFIETMTVPRTQHGMALVDGYMTVVGGSSEYGGELLIHAERYNVAFNRWQVIPNNQLRNETWGVAAIGSVPISLLKNC